MKSIPKAAVTALKSFNPNAKAFFLHADGRIGARYSKDSFQWVRHEAPSGTLTPDRAPMRTAPSG